METAAAPPRVVILNSSQDLLDVLADAFREEGFHVVTHHLLPFRRGQEDLAQFFAQHRPDVIVWELSIPYEENWAYFQQVRQTPAVSACPIILTSTNVKQLHKEADQDIDAFEVVGKPFDLNHLIELVRQALGR